MCTRDPPAWIIAYLGRVAREREPADEARDGAARGLLVVAEVVRLQEAGEVVAMVALAAGDAEVAEQKSEDLLAAVQRLSRTR